MSRVHRIVLTMFSLLALLAPLSPVSSRTVLAQAQRTEPQDVALRQADLPAGFAIAKETTDPMQPGPGVIYFVGMERPINNESLESGPIFVGQLIGRFDEAISYQGFLDERRRRAIDEDGFELVPGAPNDGGTASLQKFDGEVAAFEVGFIKRDMVIFTRWVGRRGVVTLPGLLALAGVTSGRYDEVLRARASGGAPATAAAPPPPAADAPPPPAAPPTERGRVANTGGSGANVRALPQVNSDLVHVVHDDDLVEMIGAEEVGADGRKWRNVRSESGVVGWIVGEYVVREGEAAASVAAAPPAPAAAPPPPPPPPTATPQPAPPRVVAAPTATRTPAPAPASPPSGKIDDRLAPAFQKLIGIRKAPRGGDPWGDVFKTVAQISGVSLLVGPLPAGANAVFNARQNTITVSPLMLSEDVRTIASTLAHELTHVGQAFESTNARTDCVAREVESFQMQMLIWVELYGGLAPGRTRQERSMNAMVQVWADGGDPALYKLVVDTPGYQSQCDLWVP